jgi:glucodextranase-like protein
MGRFAHIFVLLALAALAGCDLGSSSEEKSACALLERKDVAAALRSVGSRSARPARSSSEALDQSVCRFTAPGVNVGLAIDSAPQVRRRYYVRVTEQQEFAVFTPRERPHPIDDIGDPDAYGPAGAYWVPAFRQLVALSGDRMFVLAFYVKGVSAPRSRAAAEHLARGIVPSSDERPLRKRPAASRTEVTVVAPESSELVRSRSVVVRGALTGRPATVRIAGRLVRVRDGVFARRVDLRPGPNRIAVIASRSGSIVASQAVRVRRGRSAGTLARALALAHPGEMPNLLGERLSVARAVLRHAELRYRIVRISTDFLETGAWAVCSTDPAAGRRVGRRRVLVLVDRPDIFRASDTACAQD